MAILVEAFHAKGSINAPSCCYPFNWRLISGEYRSKSTTERTLSRFIIIRNFLGSFVLFTASAAPRDKTSYAVRVLVAIIFAIAISEKNLFNVMCGIAGVLNLNGEPSEDPV